MFCCCLILSYLVLCGIVLSCLVLSCLVLSCLVLTCLLLSSLVLSCLVLSCVVFSCLVLSSLVLTCLVLSTGRTTATPGVSVCLRSLPFFRLTKQQRSCLVFSFPFFCCCCLILSYLFLCGLVGFRTHVQKNVTFIPKLMLSLLLKVTFNFKWVLYGQYNYYKM